MKLEYASGKVKLQCTDVKVALKLFVGDKNLANSLFSRINAIVSTYTIKDIIYMPTFRFHKLVNKNGRDLEGFFAIDVKNPRIPWRIILRPLDETGESFHPCNIDEIVELVQIVEIREVSKHYE